jgi:hypothetical protein
VGAWGSGPFENDKALDFLGTLSETKNTAEFVARLTEALRERADESTVAAAVLVATRLNPELASGAESAAEILEANPLMVEYDVDEGLKQLAREALDDVVDDSDLRDVWEDADEFDAFQSAIAPYRRALE